MPTATTTTTNSDAEVRHVIEQAFSLNTVDGWHYPATPDLSLVRIAVFSGQYRVERRRKVTSPWLPIVTADCADFDPVAFGRWRTHWPLSVLAA